VQRPQLRAKAADVQYEVVDLTGGGGKHATVEATSNPMDQRELHVDRLKKVVKEPAGLFGEVPAVDKHEEGADVFEVERIIGHRVTAGGRGIEYFVRWKGYGAQDDQWVKAEDLHAEEALARYEREQAAKQLQVVDAKILTYADAVKSGKSSPATEPVEVKEPVRRSRRILQREKGKHKE
jgi:hypothetical protein